MEYWDKQKVLKSLKITDKHLQRMREQGAPAPVKFKGYDIKALCEWIVSKPQKRTDRTKVREYAQKILNRLLKNKPARSSDPDPSDSDEKVDKGRRAKIEPGLLPALERARQAEVDAYKSHMDFLKKSGIVNANLLSTWQSTLDILRNCERDFTKVLEARRELVSMKEVRDFLEPMIEQTRAILLNLAAKLAPGLEGMPWPDIEKKLDQEIRDAISKLTNFS